MKLYVETGKAQSHIQMYVVTTRESLQNPSAARAKAMEYGGEGLSLSKLLAGSAFLGKCCFSEAV